MRWVSDWINRATTALFYDFSVRTLDKLFQYAYHKRCVGSRVDSLVLCGIESCFTDRVQLGAAK